MRIREKRTVAEEEVRGFDGLAAGTRGVEADFGIEAVLSGYACVHHSLMALCARNCNGAMGRVDEHPRMPIKYPDDV